MTDLLEIDAKGRAPRKSATAYRTISEVSEELDVPQHVLRFWETKFSQVRPLKRGGGRRYYRPEDVNLLRRIQTLLYRDGYTIKGVQRLLREGRADGDDALRDDDPAGEADVPGEPDAPPAAARRADAGLPAEVQAELRALVDDLRQLRQALKSGR